MRSLISLIILMIIYGCNVQKTKPIEYTSETLSIQKITKSIYVHTSYLETRNFGRVGCNGMIYINKGEAIIFDTPISDLVSKELIEYVESNFDSKIKGIVVNHFHIDCLGGLNEFHEREIISYANNETIRLATKNNEIIPKKGFEKRLELKIGEEMVLNEYIGEGHTSDNIISYIESEEVLFGGCLIKKLGSGKGNLNDANIEEWPRTVKIIKEKYPKLKYVIPGHGKVGGIELLDYTIDLFNKE